MRSSATILLGSALVNNACAHCMPISLMIILFFKSEKNYHNSVRSRSFRSAHFQQQMDKNMGICAARTLHFHWLARVLTSAAEKLVLLRALTHNSHSFSQT